ncbi:zinc-dependent metalloprotease [Marinifilum sp. D714]|uniref:zinc-dependent metalloprotease n=1 Tax=Marinifilum sp. D714 TaxID=2937523 RepID=UPI0027BF84F3|nr:zinc-dependent metalloprotease [Marinifilum sp. D714]MDQ2177878.1 zinc-dependent metalloprotease [Marinifilum sp. D714]
MNLNTITPTKSIGKLMIMACILGGMHANSLASEIHSTSPEEGIFNFWKKKKKETKVDSTTSSKSKSDLKAFEEVITSDADTKKGVINIHRVKKDYYFEIADSLIGRDFLLVNKISKVPSQVNELGLNKGINYQNLLIRFEADTLEEKIWVKTYHPYYEGKEGDAITQSVKDNYIPSIREAFDLACIGKDSTSYVFKVNKVFDGSEKSLNDLFGVLGMPGSAIKSLSKINAAKSFPENVIMKSLLTTKAEGITVSIEVTSNIVLLAAEPMKPRFADRRIGYFTTKHFYYKDDQQAVENREFVNRWRLEPKKEDVEKYLAGELVEPKKQIVYYIDPSTPPQWRQAIKDGITDWQAAFEQAGFKNAIIAKDAPVDDPDFDGDDVRFSMITYAASSQANAMGPSVVDPRSGEIIEADVIWWHNVMTALHSWIRIQTGSIDPKARDNKFTDEHMAHAIRFVSSHEIGHTLGLMHNMGASYAFPVDSLRSKSFTQRMGGTAPSIMDYARFNYVAQPKDGVKNITPQIGVYDKYAIAWAYRWIDKNTPWDELQVLGNMIRKHENDPLYHYGPQQSGKNTIDPSAQSEDLGDNSMKASRYGLKNLKRIVPEVEKWTYEEGVSYEKAGKMMMGVIGQWFTYANHVIANIGGIYLDQPVYGENKAAYAHVEKAKQKDAVQYIIDEVVKNPEWITNAEIYKKTYPIRESVIGNIEYAPTTLFRDLNSQLFFSILKDERLQRMLQNEAMNGRKAYTVTEMIRDLHNGVFAKTIKRQKLDVFTRQMQKNFVDNLIITHNKTMVKTTKKSLHDHHNHCGCGHHSRMPMLCDYAVKSKKMFDSGSEIEDMESKYADRNIFYATSNRVSDVVSVKRGELMRIRDLLRNRLTIYDEATKFHYQDLLLRIEEALNIHL